MALPDSLENLVLELEVKLQSLRSQVAAHQSDTDRERQRLAEESALLSAAISDMEAAIPRLRQRIQRQRQALERTRALSPTPKSRR